jgi:hypothetical protein
MRNRLGRPLGTVSLDDLYDVFYGAFQRDQFGRALFRHEDMLLLTLCQDETWMTAVHGGSAALAVHIQDHADVVLARWGSKPGEEALLGKRCTIPWNDGRFELGGAVPVQDGTEIRWWFRRP